MTDQPTTQDTLEDEKYRKARISLLEDELRLVQDELAEIKGSIAWKIARLFWNLRLLQTWLSGLGNNRNKTTTKLEWENQPSQSEEAGKFPAKPRPVVSIVIPVHNALGFTRHCLETILAAKPSVTFELILVNNGSWDGTRSWFERYEKKNSDFAHVFNVDVNLGYGPGVNAGIRQAAGEYIVLLNNDTIVTPNWIENMIAVFERDSRVGIVSPLTNHTASGPQVDPDAVRLTPEKAFLYAESIQHRDEPLYEPHRLAFFCVMIRREVIEKVGLFDERYEYGNFEDYDFCFRTVMAGYRLAVARNSFVYHHGSATFKENNIWYQEHMNKNQMRYYARVDEITSTTFRTNEFDETQDGVEISLILHSAGNLMRLQLALACLANQTFRSFEVILTGDLYQGVNQILDAFHSRLTIRVLEASQSQHSKTWKNQALADAQGAWIAFLDESDFLYPWHLECLLNELKLTPEAGLAYSSYNLAWMGNKTTIAIPQRIQCIEPVELNKASLISGMILPIHCYLFKKSELLRVGGFDESSAFFEEQSFLLQQIESLKIVCFNRATCEHRLYTDADAPLLSPDEVDALQKIYQRMPSNNLRDTRFSDMTTKRLRDWFEL